MDRSAPIETADRFAIRRTGKKRCGYDKQCLAQELRVRGHETRTEVSVPITYKGFSFEQNLDGRNAVGRGLCDDCFRSVSANALLSFLP